MSIYLMSDPQKLMLLDFLWWWAVKTTIDTTDQEIRMPYFIHGSSVAALPISYWTTPLDHSTRGPHQVNPAQVTVSGILAIWDGNSFDSSGMELKVAVGEIAYTSVCQWHLMLFGELKRQWWRPKFIACHSFVMRQTREPIALMLVTGRD